MGLREFLTRNVLYPLDRWRSGDGVELRYLRQFERTQYMSADDLRAMALGRIRRLLDHAYGRCPWYRRRFDEAGVVPSDLRALDDLRILPILEKRDIQQHRDEMVAAGWPKDDLVPNLTGGSTGTPLSFFASRDRMRSRAAATWRHNRWAGWEIGDKVATIWGAARDAPRPGVKHAIRNLFLGGELFLNTAHITVEKLWEYNETLKRFRPKVILGYANSVALLARFLKREGHIPFQPRAIVTSAEVLEPDDRTLIEQVFGCPVFNRYGCREVSVIASECPEHSGLHVMAEGLYLEIVNRGQPVREGDVGEILVTDLLNLAMPLIRYRIGDMAIGEGGLCRCGRGLPRIRGVAGRVTDFLVGSDGRLVSGAVLTVAVVARRPSLGQVQIWQDTPGRLLYRIAPPGGHRPADADLQFLIHESKAYLGANTVVDFEFVDRIAAEPSGKHIFSRSTAANEWLCPRTYPAQDNAQAE